MDKKEKKNYEAPQLTTVTFKAEQGYAFSQVTMMGIWSGVVGQNVNVTTPATDAYGVLNYTEETSANW